MSAAGDASGNARAWGLPGVLEFFRDNRSTSQDVYPSEWHFLRHVLRDGISILDVGCAQGGFAAIAAEHVSAFSYTGLDINADMIARARARFPQHSFHVIGEGSFTVPGGSDFDLVLVLGILHLHERWRETLAAAWAQASDALVFDLRESSASTVEDKRRSYMKMDFAIADERHAEMRVPYNVINEREAETTVEAICMGARQIEHYGYAHATTTAAVTPFAEVTTRVWCARR